MKKYSLAEIRWYLTRANLTDEEEMEFTPWAWNNKPMPVSEEYATWSRGFYSRIGPEIRECKGYIFTFSDGSKYRLDDRDELAEVLPL